MATRVKPAGALAALRALLAAIEDPDSNDLRTCSRLTCHELAMVSVYGDAMCDECATEYPKRERHDLSYAPAVRSARAALGRKP